MQSKATSVQEYIKELPPDRRAAIEAVRKVILDNLDRDFEEGMQYGMIGYFVPHRIFPDGYHCDPRQPLPFAALASQKNYMSVYLMTTYGNDDEENWFRREWAASGKKLDMGKSCIRFKKLDDLALEVIGDAVRRVPAKDYIAWYQKLRDRLGRGTKAKPSRAAPRKAAAKVKKRATSKRAAGTKSKK